MKNLYSLKSILLIVFYLLGLNTGFGQSKAEQIEKLMTFSHETGQFNGSLVVAEHGKVIYKKGFGLANMEWDIPNQANTKFRLGSITKQFTAVLVMQLVEQGKIKLDAPIVTYLPGYPPQAGEKVTIHHLLSQSSGIKDYTNLPGFRNGGSQNALSPEALIKLFADQPLEFEPGEKFAYSNSNYVLLGKIIERVTGSSYAQYVQDNIFTPLKMQNSGYDNSSIIVKSQARGYEQNGDGYVNASYVNMNNTYAAGALYSTVEDLFLWDQALYSPQLLSAKSLNLLFANQMAINKNSYYGYGWYVGEVSNLTKNRLRIAQHSGNLPGFVTRICRMPSDKNLIVLLNNTTNAPLREISDAISAILYDKPFTMPRISLAKTIFEIMAKQGLAMGVEKIKQLKNSEAYIIQEVDMNEGAYQLLQAGKMQEALEMLKLNAETFPSSGNVYDSLGEAYLKTGNKELAIINYKKAVELDSKNDNAKKMLNELTR
ncbi:serine hydrolase [Chryseobacterium polytrichastri]|uniref:CubicO group peptidase, beta-lactamase class C family n=1 Tax=Chryseobacterium polytrichastri TaxID=1302687 RepID=A0A1M7BTC4_9FLAO|nr:serine hydrolase [Chryseobacterium polytrichastri]SHL58230.1 CubicO group peptidase, beta-lactamase class C family [Chryseobacterium polytrichastri]